MLTNTFKQFLVASLWKLLAYVHVFLAFLVRIVPRLSRLLGTRYQDRLRFELKNTSDVGCKSFYLENKKAHVCFQFSSEGEFEQIRWFVEEAIEEKKCVELIFTSDSVEEKIIKLFTSYPEQIRYLRTPLVTISTKDLSHWITASSIVMVRYDFYPMILSQFYEKNLILLWFFRPMGKKGFISCFKWSCILPLMDFVVSSNIDDWWWLKDKVPFDRLMSVPMDFRSLSILKRIKQKQQVLEFHFGGFEKVLQPLLNKHVTIIHGNAYETELHYLGDLHWKNQIKNKMLILAIVAHHVDSITVEKIADHYQIKTYLIESGISSQKLESIITEWNKEPGVLLFKGKGFLLELYAKFQVALVGGGFFGHTHSVLEPYLAGCTVYCGPNVYRSSEYYQVKAIDDKKIFSLATIEQWRSECLNKIKQLENYMTTNLTNKSHAMSDESLIIHARKLLNKMIEN